MNGKIVIDATERALHHYGSGINAVATLGAFVRLPNDTALLELGHGATMGTLTTIDPVSGNISSEHEQRGGGCPSTSGGNLPSPSPSPCSCS